MTTTVELAGGLLALVDDQDAALVLPHRWSAVWTPSTQTYYAVSLPCRGRRTFLRMHRVITGTHDGEVDHRNRDTLDNRRANLRVATHGENMRNRRGWGASGYLGAYRTSSGRWSAVVRIDGRNHYLGRFDTAVDAALARDQYVRDHHPSEFWTFNFPRAGEAAANRPEGAIA